MHSDELKELNGGYSKLSVKEKRKHLGRYLWEDFVGNSTLHGLHYVFQKRPGLQRFIWLILHGFMFSLFIWQTSTIAQKYLEFDVTSSIELVTEEEVKFPVITFCNFNKYRKSFIKDTDFFKVIEKKYPLYENENNSVDWTKYPKINDLNMTAFIYNVSHQMDYDNTTKKGMLYYCTWKGEICDKTYFKPTLTDMGLCHTFTPDKSNNSKVTAPGKHSGLHLRISVEQSEYIGFLEFSAGLKIRIHDPDELPLVSGLGFAVMPGSHVYASITRQRTISLKSPYKTMCEDKKLPGVKKYTIAACYEVCKQNYIAKSCKCQTFYMRDIKYKPCNVKQYLNCVYPLEEKYSSSSNSSKCECPESCDSMKYNVYLSYGSFPSNASATLYAATENTTSQNFRTNMVAIDVFYEDLIYKVLRQVPAYTLQSLLGEIGGLMGLFLGASILTMMEFVDVAVMLILTRLGIHK
ncbi:acid-sensing ion channel 1-like isoform X2 [Xenia sp. Carnegie-2017]|uniref:acid-sensing ion channel 1-like isoform X2 n=2 Tax=Xenia sp. Carnegie-2017 TaxID=2897299 RepID=UPI001F04DA33|nr:acid-sensing ion channel 1-like isoform X2 [Xenia sp. Carnegie-2017]